MLYSRIHGTQSYGNYLVLLPWLDGETAFALLNMELSSTPHLWCPKIETKRATKTYISIRLNKFMECIPRCLSDPIFIMSVCLLISVTMWSLLKICKYLLTVISLHVVVEYRRQIKTFQLLFVKTFRYSHFHSHILILHVKCIQISTNKPSIGSVVPVTALTVFRKHWQISCLTPKL